MSNLCLPMREQSQKSIDSQMQQNVRDERDHQWEHQRMPALNGRTGNDTSERSVKRIRNGDDELNKSSATARRE